TSSRGPGSTPSRSSTRRPGRPADSWECPASRTVPRRICWSCPGTLAPTTVPCASWTTWCWAVGSWREGPAGVTTRGRGRSRRRVPRRTGSRVVRGPHRLAYSDAVCARAGPLPVRARHPEARQRPHDPTGCGGTHPNIPEGESTHVAVKIRLKRMGKIRAPFYRIVVADSRKKRDGAVLEEIGKYHPTENPSLIEIQSERALYWLGVGAQPSEQVAALLKVTGDWAKFKGEGDVAGS